mmetsp:Transcript_40274/g.67140  ORF Transcript_40274/g.67140 Transcript_40274/m.67140 type:complete len:251 (-) Transcript_40274:89-841(-)
MTLYFRRYRFRVDRAQSFSCGSAALERRRSLRLRRGMGLGGVRFQMLLHAADVLPLVRGQGVHDGDGQHPLQVGLHHVVHSAGPGLFRRDDVVPRDPQFPSHFPEQPLRLRLRAGFVVHGLADAEGRAVRKRCAKVRPDKIPVGERGRQVEQRPLNRMLCVAAGHVPAGLAQLVDDLQPSLKCVVTAIKKVEGSHRRNHHFDLCLDQDNGMIRFFLPQNLQPILFATRGHSPPWGIQHSQEIGNLLLVCF